MTSSCGFDEDDTKEDDDDEVDDDVDDEVDEDVVDDDDDDEVDDEVDDDVARARPSFLYSARFFSSSSSLLVKGKGRSIGPLAPTCCCCCCCCCCCLDGFDGVELDVEDVDDDDNVDDVDADKEPADTLAAGATSPRKYASGVRNLSPTAAAKPLSALEWSFLNCPPRITPRWGQ